MKLSMNVSPGHCISIILCSCQLLTKDLRDINIPGMCKRCPSMCHVCLVVVIHISAFEKDSLSVCHQGTEKHDHLSNGTLQDCHPVKN